MLSALLVGAVLHGQERGRAHWRTDLEYDGRFTFVRLRWESGVRGRLRGMSDAWNHDFPRAEQNLMTILHDLTLINARTDGGLILTLDDPRLFAVQFSGTGFYSVDPSNEAYKLGVNYMLYGLTH